MFGILLVMVWHVEKVGNILRIEGVYPLIYQQSLVQQLDFSVLFLVLRFVSCLIHIAFQLHWVKVYDLPDHFVEQIDPTERNLCINFVCLLLFEGLNFFSVGFFLEHLLNRDLNFLHIWISFSFLLLHLTHSTTNSGEHIFLNSFCLLSNYFLKFVNFLFLLLQSGFDCALKLHYFVFKKIVVLDDGFELIKVNFCCFRR